MIRRVVIAKHERGFYLKDGAFQRVLRPGVHWLAPLLSSFEVRRVSELSPRVEFADIEVLAREPAVAAELQICRVKDNERALVFREGNFVGILGSGFHAFLKTPAVHKLEIVDTNEIELTHPLKNVIVRGPDTGQFITLVEVPEGSKGILFLDNVRDRILEPGRYFFWNGIKHIAHQVVDGREQTLEIQGQELMTLDKVSLRINLSARYAVTDPVKALATQTSFKDAVYRDLQLALRDEVGARSLDDLLARKEEVGKTILDRVREPALAMGVALSATGLKDLILPGEMRTILNQVIEAEKRAQANMIARREETAATRNLMNTAKLLENNPVLMHLKELESTERIAEKIGSLSVCGGIDGLLEALRVAARPAPKGGGEKPS